MQWKEIRIATKHPFEDIIAAILTDEFGAKGVAIDDPALVNAYIDSGVWDYTSLEKSTDTESVTVTAYLSQDGAAEKITVLKGRLNTLKTDTDNAVPTTITVNDIADEDWSESWKKYFRVTKIGQRLVIKPTWEEYTPQTGEVVLEVDPGAAFGTGTHPTTSLCLTAMDLSAKTVFDVGTGSGILATAAAKLGAAQVVAVDNDETAVKVARENVLQNNVADKVSLSVGNLLQGVEGYADLIVANIVADVILLLLPQIDEHLALGGKFLTGGIIADREEEILQAAKKYGFTPLKSAAKKEWRSILFERAEKR